MKNTPFTRYYAEKAIARFREAYADYRIEESYKRIIWRYGQDIVV